MKSFKIVGEILTNGNVQLEVKIDNFNNILIVFS